MIGKNEAYPWNKKLTPHSSPLSPIFLHDGSIMKKLFSLQTKLFLAVILPLMAVSLTALIGLQALEERSISEILSQKRDLYEKSWQTLVNNKGDFLSFTMSIIRTNKPLIRTLKAPDSKSIIQHSDNLWNQISEKISNMFFWQPKTGNKNIIFSFGFKNKIKSIFSVPLLEEVLKSKKSTFGFEHFPDGQVRLMQASAFFNAPGKPYNLIAQGINLKVLIDELKRIIQSQNIEFIPFSPWETEKIQEPHIHYYKNKHQVFIDIPLKNIHNHPLGFLRINEDLSHLIDGFHITQWINLSTTLAVLIFSLLMVFWFLKSIKNRTNTLLKLLTLVSKEEKLPPIKDKPNPDAIDFIQKGIYDTNHTIVEAKNKLVMAKEAAEKEIKERIKIERINQRIIISQTVVGQIFKTSFEPISLKEQLEKSLDWILSIPWLFEQSKGAIFLFNDNDQKLHLTAHKGLDPKLLDLCHQVDLGCCLCGQAADSRHTVYAAHMDDRHHIFFDGIQPHGHYSVPILSGEQLLGVVTLYLTDGHIQEEEEKELLQSTANALTGLIERKKNEEELEEVNEVLEERVKYRTSELNQSLKELKSAQTHLVQSEKMSALGGLVAGIAHEINTPVGIGFLTSTHLEDATQKIISSFNNNTMKRSDLNLYLETATESSQLILSNLRRAADLIQSFKRVAVDQASEERRVFQIKTYLEEIILNLHPKFKQTKHQITLTCPEDLQIESYPGALSQIITNLILNSLIHGFDKKEAGSIKLSVSCRDKDLFILYRDTGKGMDDSVRKKIFDPFFTTKRGYGGSGLGMHIVFNLVTQNLGGRIECQNNQESSGALFLITIPTIAPYPPSNHS